MKLTVKLDFGCGREIKVGTFSEIGRDTAFEFAGEFLSSGLDPAPFRLRAGGGLKIYDRSGNMETFGLFDDSLPDGWGRRIVDRMFMKREGRLPTVTERLMCVGRSGKGALVYEPADEVAQAANEAFDLAALAEEALAFDAGEAESALPRLPSLPILMLSVLVWGKVSTQGRQRCPSDSHPQVSAMPMELCRVPKADKFKS